MAHAIDDHSNEQTKRQTLIVSGFSATQPAIADPTELTYEYLHPNPTSAPFLLPSTLILMTVTPKPHLSLCLSTSPKP
jgi:hypothetical protein